ncbi:MAG: serine hydrolase, partial [Acidimicrobiia bacterium]|nr:serine hydrolase [Acidimicrobiia bacterium]
LVALPAAAFDDDDRMGFEADFSWLAERGAVTGCAADRVCPQRAITRIEAAKMTALLGQHFGRWDVPDYDTSRFTDLDDVWDGNVGRYPETLAEASVVAGCGADRFCPNRLLTRGEASVFLVRAFGLVAPESWASPYEDTSGTFYADAARIAAAHGLWPLRDGTGHLRGNNPITRAEFARALARAGGATLCTSDPFSADRIRSVDGVRVTAYAWDERTGCHYWLYPDRRQSTASVFKVMVMAGTLHEAQEAGRGPTGWEVSQMEPMITESANAPVRTLWSSFGGAPWFAEQARLFGLDQTVTVGDYERGWGATKTSAADQVYLLRQVILGHGGLLEPAHRRWALEFMSSVVPEQRWGVGTAPPPGATVFQKNGFAGVTANSVGVVRRSDGSHYVMAVLTTGWSHWTAGVPTVDRVSGWIHAALG